MIATLTLARHFAAPPARVYTAWTNPQHFAQWIGPVGVPCDLLHMDAQEGGTFRLDMHLPDGRTVHVAGRFTRLHPPDQIDLDWGAADGSITTQVSIRLRPTPAGTEMTFLHHLPSPDMVQSHDDGWSSAFTKLQRFLEP